MLKHGFSFPDDLFDCSLIVLTYQQAISNLLNADQDNEPPRGIPGTAWSCGGQILDSSVRTFYDLFQNILAMRVPLTCVCVCVCVCVCLCVCVCVCVRVWESRLQAACKPYTKSTFHQPAWCCDQPTVR